jgi:hypothetical protein
MHMKYMGRVTALFVILITQCIRIIYYYIILITTIYNVWSHNIPFFFITVLFYSYRACNVSTISNRENQLLRDLFIIKNAQEISYTNALVHFLFI